VLWKQQDVEGALAECAQALADDPNSDAMVALQAVGLWKLDRKREAQEVLRGLVKSEPQTLSGEAFCRLILCDGRDVVTVGDFLHKNRWIINPPPEP
jgi:hypothetical protein